MVSNKTKIKKLLFRLEIALIFLYRRLFYPFFSFLHLFFPVDCKFYPTCSVYTQEVLEKHGPFKGALLGFRRILRCNPFSAGGINLS